MSRTSRTGSTTPPTGAFIDLITLRRTDYDKIRDRDPRRWPARSSARSSASWRRPGRSPGRCSAPPTRRPARTSTTTRTRSRRATWSGTAACSSSTTPRCAARPAVRGDRPQGAGRHRSRTPSCYSTEPVAGKPIKTTLDVTHAERRRRGGGRARSSPARWSPIRISDGVGAGGGQRPGRRHGEHRADRPGAARLDLQDGLRVRPAAQEGGHRRRRSSTARRPRRSTAARSRTRTARCSARSRSTSTSPSRATPRSSAWRPSSAPTACRPAARRSAWAASGTSASTRSPARSRRPTARPSWPRPTFGQGATAVSPLAMAGATAAVARGQFEQPKLVLDPAPAKPAADGPALDATAVEPSCGTMMREVVTGGTGYGAEGRCPASRCSARPARPSSRTAPSRHARLVRRLAGRHRVRRDGAEGRGRRRGRRSRSSTAS